MGASRGRDALYGVLAAILALVGGVASLSDRPPSDDARSESGATTDRVRVVRGGTAPSASAPAVADVSGLMLLDVPSPNYVRMRLPVGKIEEFGIGSQVLAGLILVRIGIQEVELGYPDGRRTVLRVVSNDLTREPDLAEAAVDPGGPPLASNSFVCTGFSC